MTVAYGKDEVQDFGELLVRAQLDQGKMLVRDVLRDVGFRKGIELERGQEEKQLRAAALELQTRAKDQPRPWAELMNLDPDRGFGGGCERRSGTHVRLMDQ